MCTPLYNDTLRGCFTVEEKKKYLQDGVNCCGYVGGILFANQLGLTTQVPTLYEVYTRCRFQKRKFFYFLKVETM